ncbi:MAG TPA: glycosyltransferase family 2 protein [Verrucomicrobiae bacterium]|jgi:glycosyltransferase involved in cell wall biosynthesis|nr:glycosyltransferase family 2 protein [Verrucomicrobiae bacterium]
MNTSNYHPLVSIVLPCRNEQGRIQDSLESILKQEPPEGGVEILVADGMSTDGTNEYLQQMAREHPQIRVLDNPGRIVSTGLNAAIRAARGDIIVRMDAHTIYAPDYVRQCLTVLSETGADNVGGPMQTTAKTYKERAIRAVFHSAFAVGGARSHLAGYEGCVDTVIYGCWKKEVFERIGYFDEELVRNQDDEHNFRLTRAGGKIYQSTRIRSWYHVRGSLRALFRQYMQYGYWKVLVIRKHRKLASWRHVMPGAFLGSLCLLAAVGLLWPPALWVAAGLGALYAATTVAAAVIIAARAQWTLLPILPAVIACFHFGYGYGFLRGILDFAVLNNAPEAKFVQLTRERVPKPGKVQS